MGLFQIGRVLDNFRVDPIDVATGTRRTLLSEPGCSFESPAVSDDGRYVVCVKETFPTADDPGDYTLVLVDLGEDPHGKDLLPDLDSRPSGPTWAKDGSAVYFTADDQGRGPVFRLTLGTGEVTRLARVRVVPWRRWKAMARRISSGSMRKPFSRRTR